MVCCTPLLCKKTLPQTASLVRNLGWIPGYLLYHDHDADWAGRLVDQMLYGRTFLFDGSPVIDDVWIDEDGDGDKSCNSVPGDCEWKRIVVVSQGKGGPITLALDITDTTAPTLWEQHDESESTPIGYTTSRPVSQCP